jgi:hypothetical protein
VPSVAPRNPQQLNSAPENAQTVPSDLQALAAFASRHTAGGAAPSTIAEGTSYKAIAEREGHAPSSRAYTALKKEASRHAALAAMDGMSCLDAARKFHIDDDAHAVETLQVDIATYKGHDLLAATKTLEDVREQLGITPGTLADRLLAVGFKDRVPLRAAPAHRPDPRPTRCAPDPDAVHVLRREPNSNRSLDAEAGLTMMCLRVAKGADYRQVAKECGYEVTNTDFEGVCTEYVALHAQAMHSARMAILGGNSVPKAAARFSITESSDLYSLAMYAAREVGVPKVQAHVPLPQVKAELGISGYAEARRLLFAAIPLAEPAQRPGAE